MVNLSLLCRNNGISFTEQVMSNESLIQRARNYLADDFMRSGFTHMLWIDSDIEFNPHDVISMLALSDYHSEYDILCAAYPKKTIAWEKVLKAAKSGQFDEKPEGLEAFTGDYVFNVKRDANGDGVIQMNRPAPVLEGGTGFMMVQRKAYEIFADNFPDIYYRPDHKRSKYFDGKRKIAAFFECPIDRGTSEYELWDIIRKAASGQKVKQEAVAALERLQNATLRLWSEDYSFCQLAQKAGLKVWLCPWINLNHYGTYGFRGNLGKVLSMGNHPTMGPDVEVIKPTGVVPAAPELPPL